MKARKNWQKSCWRIQNLRLRQSILYPSIGWGLTMEKYSVNGLADVGYSDGMVAVWI